MGRTLGLTEEDEELLERAARLVSGKWDSTIEQVLCGMFKETASHNERSGGNAHKNWCRSLRALGKTCIALADRDAPITQ